MVTIEDALCERAMVKRRAGRPPRAYSVVQRPTLRRGDGRCSMACARRQQPAPLGPTRPHQHPRLDLPHPVCLTAFQGRN